MEDPHWSDPLQRVSCSTGLRQDLVNFEWGFSGDLVSGFWNGNLSGSKSSNKSAKEKSNKNKQLQLE